MEKSEIVALIEDEDPELFAVYQSLKWLPLEVFQTTKLCSPLPAFVEMLQEHARSLDKRLNTTRISQRLALANDYPARVGSFVAESHTQAVLVAAKELLHEAHCMTGSIPDFTFPDLAEFPLIDLQTLAENWEYFHLRINRGGRFEFDVTEVDMQLEKEFQRAMRLPRTENEPPPPPKEPALHVDFKGGIATLNGKQYPLDTNPLMLLDAVRQAAGEWINGSGIMAGFRPDRAANKLPPELRVALESASGKGWRLKREYL